MKAAFHTLGCKVNAYETQAVAEQFRRAGFVIAGFSDRADVYVINTCALTRTAEHKSRQMIHRARRLNPDAVIVAAGCYAQRAADDLKEEDGADIIVGNNKKSRILPLVLDFLKQREESREAFGSESGETFKNKKIILLEDLSKKCEYESQSITSTGGNARAYVKIQDGCSRFCAYCVIPYVRGRSRSRREEEVLDEIATLAAGGYKEVVLTGIDISMYADLIGLVERAADIDGIERVRLGSLEASVITEDFLGRLSACEKACPHFHLSLQSGCDETLKRMRRHYTAEEFSRKVSLIRERFALCAVTADVIVGFPGETDREFEESLEFVRKTAFSRLHVFRYSGREGTAAYAMPDQVSEKVKSARAEEMLKAAEEMKKNFENSLFGLVRPVLFEERVVGRDENEFQLGYTPEYVKVAASCAQDLVGRIVPVKITGGEKESLPGAASGEVFGKEI